MYVDNKNNEQVGMFIKSKHCKVNQPPPPHLMNSTVLHKVAVQLANQKLESKRENLLSNEIFVCCEDLIKCTKEI